MPFRIRDAQGNVVAEFDQEPTEDDLQGVFGSSGPKWRTESADEVWKRIRGAQGLPDEPFEAQGPAGPPAGEDAMAPPPPPKADGFSPLDPNDLKNAAKAVGSGLLRITGLPFEALDEKLASTPGGSFVQEKTAEAFPRKQEWEQSAEQPEPGSADIFSAVPYGIRSLMDSMRKKDPSSAEYTSAFFRPLFRMGAQLPMDPRTYGVLGMIPINAVKALLSAGFTADMLIAGKESGEKAMEIMRQEGMSPDAVEATMEAVTSTAMGAMLMRGGEVQGARARIEGLKPGKSTEFYDPYTGQVGRATRGPVEGEVVPPPTVPPERQLESGAMKPPPGEVVDAEVLRRDGVAEPSRQIERGALVTPPSETPARGSYPAGPSSRVQTPLNVEAPPPAPPPAAPAAPPAPPAPLVPSPRLEAMIAAYPGKTFGTALNKLERAAKRSGDPEALALVKEARRWEAEQQVAAALGRPTATPVPPLLRSQPGPPPSAPPGAPTPAEGPPPPAAPEAPPQEDTLAEAEGAPIVETGLADPWDMEIPTGPQKPPKPASVSALRAEAASRARDITDQIDQFLTTHDNALLATAGKRKAVEKARKEGKLSAYNKVGTGEVENLNDLIEGYDPKGLMKFGLDELLDSEAEFDWKRYNLWKKKLKDKLYQELLDEHGLREDPATGALVPNEDLMAPPPAGPGAPPEAPLEAPPELQSAVTLREDFALTPPPSGRGPTQLPLGVSPTGGARTGTLGRVPQGGLGLEEPRPPEPAPAPAPIEDVPPPAPPQAPPTDVDVPKAGPADASGNLLIPGFMEAVSNTPVMTEGRLEGGLFDTPPPKAGTDVQLELAPPPEAPVPVDVTGEPVPPTPVASPADAVREAAKALLAGIEAEISRLKAEREALTASGASRAEKEKLRLAQVAAERKLSRAKERIAKEEADALQPPPVTPAEAPPTGFQTPGADPANPLSYLPSATLGVDEVSAQVASTLKSNLVTIPDAFRQAPEGWTPRHDEALALYQAAAAARRATGKGGNPAVRAKLRALEAWVSHRLETEFPAERLAARDAINRALKADSLGDLLVPGKESEGKHLRLGVQGPRVTVTRVMPSGIHFEVRGRAGELQVVSIDELSGKNYRPYEEMSADTVLEVAQELAQKELGGSRKGELGAVRPGALMGLLGFAAATPLAIAFPGETIALALLTAVGTAAFKGKLSKMSAAADALARASAAGRLSVAALNAAAAVTRMSLAATGYAASAAGSMLIPGRKAAAFRGEALEKAKAAVAALHPGKGLESTLVGLLAGAHRDPALWEKLGTLNPILASRLQSYLDSHLKEDNAWQEIMTLAGVPPADRERFSYFTQGQVDPGKVRDLGALPASAVNSMLIFNSAIDRTTRMGYVSMSLAPILKRYGVQSLTDLQKKVWKQNPLTGDIELAIPLDEYKDVQYAIDTAITGAMNYSGGLTAERVHFWRWIDPAVRAVNQMPLPLAMVAQPNIALFANYILANVPEVMLQSNPLTAALAPRFKASMEARGIQDKAFAAMEREQELLNDIREAKELLALEQKRNAALARQDAAAYRRVMEPFKEILSDAREAYRDAVKGGLRKPISEWRQRRRSRYYNKQQLFVEFMGAGVWLFGLAAAARLMRGEDGTAPLEIQTQKEDGTSEVIDLKRLLGPLAWMWWMGDMASRKVENAKDPTKFTNVQQWQRYPNLLEGINSALGYRQSPLDWAVADLNLTSPEGIDNFLRTAASQIGGMYARMGGWGYDVYKGAEFAMGGTPEVYKDPLVEPTAMMPIPAGDTLGAAKQIGGRVAGTVERTILPDWFADLQAAAGVPKENQAHVAASWDKLLMQRRPLQLSPLSWFFTMREQSELTRFLNNIEGESLQDVLPARTRVEWYDELVNQKIAERAREDGLFELLADESTPPEVRYAGLVARMQDYRLEAHVAAKRYADDNDLLLPNAASIADAARWEELRGDAPGELRRRIMREAAPWKYNMPGWERDMSKRRQRRLVEDLELNLPPYDLDGPPVQ